MDDLISREAAIDALVEELAHRPEGYWDSGLNRYDVEVVLSQQPSVDAVEVVRCKDCKYADFGECTHKLGLIVADDENYCSYGERKDDQHQ